MSVKKHARNQEIRATEVRLILEDGEQGGVMPLRAALNLAEESDLDLVELSPDANPPVCRIMDYSKRLYEIRKAKAAQKKSQKQFKVKEIKFRPGTEEGDYQVKLKHLTAFIEAGDKVKVTLRYRGRELAHKELGKQLLERIVDDTDTITTVEQFPKMEGRQMILVLAPKRNT